MDGLAQGRQEASGRVDFAVKRLTDVLSYQKASDKRAAASWLADMKASCNQAESMVAAQSLGDQVVMEQERAGLAAMPKMTQYVVESEGIGFRLLTESAAVEGEAMRQALDTASACRGDKWRDAVSKAHAVADNPFNWPVVFGWSLNECGEAVVEDVKWKVQVVCDVANGIVNGLSNVGNLCLWGLQAGCGKFGWSWTWVIPTADWSRNLVCQESDAFHDAVVGVGEFVGEYVGIGLVTGGVGAVAKGGIAVGRLAVRGIGKGTVYLKNLCKAAVTVERSAEAVADIIAPVRGVVYASGEAQGIVRLARPGRVMFDGMEVRAVRGLAHVDEGTLRAMVQRGFAAKDIHGRPLVLHHLGQIPAGPLVEIPAPLHNIHNPIQHPFGNATGVGLTVEQRAAFDAWRIEYWKARALDELTGRGL